MGYPFTDTFNGGTLAGRIAGLDKTIEIAGPQTKIIPGHEPIVDRSAVVAQRDFLLATRDRMRVLIAQGKTVEQVLAANVTGDEISVPPRAQTAEQFVRWLYSELKNQQ